MTTDRPVDEVFGLLADETRIEILRAIATAQGAVDRAGAGPVELAFSEIYERVDVDNTAKLSYHLGQLSGVYLHKSDTGYSFTHAGERIVRFILAGNYGHPPELGAEPIDGICLFCGEADLEASLRHQFFRIECTACETPVAGQPITPAQARARGTEALIRSVKRRNVRDCRQIRQGMCPECGGVLSVEVLDLREGALPDGDPFLVQSRCKQCLREYNVPLAYSVAYHPASVAFHWDRGVDVTSKGLWEFHGRVYEGRWTSTKIASTPPTYEVELAYDDDLLRVRLDATATVIRTERVRRENGEK